MDTNNLIVNNNKNIVGTVSTLLTVEPVNDLTDKKFI